MTNNNVMPINPETGTIYSRAELTAAFERVQNTVNWKLSIASVIPASAEDITREAVIFFAGCTPTFHKLTNGNLFVEAVGYYAAVGA